LFQFLQFIAQFCHKFSVYDQHSWKGFAWCSGNIQKPGVGAVARGYRA